MRRKCFGLLFLFPSSPLNVPECSVQPWKHTFFPPFHLRCLHHSSSWKYHLFLEWFQMLISQISFLLPYSAIFTQQKQNFLKLYFSLFHAFLLWNAPRVLYHLKSNFFFFCQTWPYLAWLLSISETSSPLSLYPSPSTLTMVSFFLFLKHHASF